MQFQSWSKSFVCPSIWVDEILYDRELFSSWRPRELFALNCYIRRWTAHFQEERCWYPHTGICLPSLIWWHWPASNPTRIERDSGISLWLAVQIHTLSPGLLFWPLCWREAPTSGPLNGLNIAQETAVGKWWSTNLGTGSPASRHGMWLHGQCHLCSKTTWCCWDAWTLGGTPMTSWMGPF